jgi:hypothetical protein
MPSNSTTRRGNGAGWGGAARGGESASATGKAGPGRGISGKSVADIMAAQGARELAAQRWIEILNDPAHPHHATMVAKAADRMDGASTQRIEVADKRAEDMTDEELAAIASRGSRAPAGAAED